MKTTLLNEPEDLRWLRETKLKQLSPTMMSAILHGNEDSPELIEIYKEQDPDVGDNPAEIWRLNTERDVYVRYIPL